MSAADILALALDEGSDDDKASCNDDRASCHDDDHSPSWHADDDRDSCPLDARAVLNLAAPGHGSHCRGRGSTLKKLQKKRQRQIKHKQASAQFHYFDRQGYGRTADFSLLQADSKKKRFRVFGKGQHKRWRPEAVLRASESAACSSRTSGPEGSGNASNLQCRSIEAECIISGQDAGIQKINAESRKRKLDFFITANMYDETKLPFGKPSRKRRCLAWHGQVTYCKQGGDVQDADVIRPPRLLRRYTAATLWNLMAKSEDTCGLQPCGDARPEAQYHGTITIADSHSVNHLVNKNLEVSLPPSNFLLGSLCMQHRAGSVCEEVAKRWNLIAPTLCLANQMEHADFYEDLQLSVTAVVDKYLNLVTPEAAARKAQSARGLCKFAEELLAVCHVSTLPSNQDGDDVNEGKRAAEAKDFLKFFPPPWADSLDHPCPAGCCGVAPCADRATSVQRGSKLIMTVVLPHISRPAANRYTKVFPVVCRGALILNFFTVFKKAIRRQLQNRHDNSDDERVLNNPDAVVGAPADAISHHRKLQAHY